MISKCKPTLIIGSYSDTLATSPNQAKSLSIRRSALQNMKLGRWLYRGLLALGVAGSLAFGVPSSQARAPRSWADPAMAGHLGTVAESQLPRAAQRTLATIRRGGPFPYAKDGVIFGNYEKRLPRRPRGYYHEYTVPTRGAHNRGARRIVCGGDQRAARDCYYTGDHYNSFQFIEE